MFQAGNLLYEIDLSSIEQLIPDWSKKLLIDIKIADADQSCAEVFSTDQKNTEELFANIWQGERLIYTPREQYYEKWNE